MGGGNSSSTSTSTITHYEPDKVRVAEINQQTELEVARLAGRNIQLQKQAKIEIIETNARMEALLIEAKVRGFDMVAQTLVRMTKELNMLGEQRIAMIESASLNVLKKMNEQYFDFKVKINEDTNNFIENTTFTMLKKLEEFDETSASHKIYAKSIDNCISDFLSNQSNYVNKVMEQQDKLLDSNIDLRKKINSNIDSIVSNRVKHLEMAVANHKDVKALNDSKSKQLEK